MLEEGFVGVDHFVAVHVLDCFFPGNSMPTLTKAANLWANKQGQAQSKFLRYDENSHKRMFRFCRRMPAKNMLLIPNPAWETFCCEIVKYSGLPDPIPVLSVYNAAYKRFATGIMTNDPYCVAEKLADMKAMDNRIGVVDQYATIIDAIYGGRAAVDENGVITFSPTNLFELGVEVNLSNEEQKKAAAIMQIKGPKQVERLRKKGAARKKNIDTPASGKRKRSGVQQKQSESTTTQSKKPKCSKDAQCTRCCKELKLHLQRYQKKCDGIVTTLYCGTCKKSITKADLAKNWKILVPGK
jgi:hypothetical protein